MNSLLSINVNRVALLRNSRPGPLPSLTNAARECIVGGADGITIHPRPDERHITRADVGVLTRFLGDHNAGAVGDDHQKHVEFNIEGYPSDEFIDIVLGAKPEQCTLVPDTPEQATSDHGWDVGANAALLTRAIERLKAADIRVSLFVDPELSAIEAVHGVGADRIELYTEPYALAFGTASQDQVLGEYTRCAVRADELGLGINAGHDLNLANLPAFASLPGLAECSIGHAVACDALFVGLRRSVELYAQAIRGQQVEHDWYPTS